MSLTKADILGAKDRKIIKVSTPEWGGAGHVCLRELNGTGRDAIMRMYGKVGEGQTPPNIMAEVLVRCLCDKDGELLFKSSEVAALNSKSGAMLERLFTQAAELNGLAGTEDAEKNSDSTPSADSTSA